MCLACAFGLKVRIFLRILALGQNIFEYFGLGLKSFLASRLRIKIFLSHLGLGLTNLAGS
jgi:hypothetical protein